LKVIGDHNSPVNEMSVNNVLQAIYRTIRRTAIDREKSVRLDIAITEK
jgi:hypothetical protein